MRETLFKGKRKDNGEWVYGHLADDNLIVVWDKTKEPYGYEEYQVDPETVGQFTGLTDSTKWEQLTVQEQEDWLKTTYIADDGSNKNNTQETWRGKKIFEGDILKCGSETQFVVQWDSDPAGFVFYDFVSSRFHDGEIKVRPWGTLCDGVEVIGNIHDNPELLEVAK